MNLFTGINITKLLFSTLLLMKYENKAHKVSLNEHSTQIFNVYTLI